MAMGHRWTLSLLLLMLSRSARLDEDDRRVDRVVFGLKGQTIIFPVPEGVEWGFVECKWPRDLAYYKKVKLLGEGAVKTGFALYDFSPEDEGRRYSITTDDSITKTAVTNYRAVLAANTIEVDVGATLHITPETSGAITWRYTPTSVTKATDLVDVLRHNTFMNRAHVDTTGKLSLSDWGWRDSGFFTAEINGKKFAENFKVVSIVRVTTGGDLHLDPDLVARPSQLSWYRNNELVVELGDIGGAVVYQFRHCLTANNCNLDLTTGKLTIKSWQKHWDGVFTLKINGQLQQHGIKVVGDVIFVPLIEYMQFVPPPSVDGPLTSTLWKNGGNLAAEYIDADDPVSYWLICDDGNCILDKTTGILTVKTWDPSNDKTFTVELNQMEKPYQYVVVKKLDDYDAQVKTQRVDTRNTNLICAGDLDGAGPVKYFWRKVGNPNWVQGKNVMVSKHTYVKGGRYGYEYDACKIKNPVSEREIMLNP